MPGSMGPVAQATMAPLCGAVFLLTVACEGQQPPPEANDVDEIQRAISQIVSQCRSVERGFVSQVDDAALGDAVDVLVEAAAEFDQEAAFSLPEPALESRTTVKDRAEFAARQLQQGECAPQQAERLLAAFD